MQIFSNAKYVVELEIKLGILITLGISNQVKCLFCSLITIFYKHFNLTRKVAFPTPTSDFFFCEEEF